MGALPRHTSCSRSRFEAPVTRVVFHASCSLNPGRAPAGNSIVLPGRVEASRHSWTRLTASLEPRLSIGPDAQPGSLATSRVGHASSSSNALRFFNNVDRVTSLRRRHGSENPPRVRRGFEVTPRPGGVGLRSLAFSPRRPAVRLFASQDPGLPVDRGDRFSRSKPGCRHGGRSVSSCPYRVTR